MKKTIDLEALKDLLKAVVLTNKDRVKDAIDNTTIDSDGWVSFDGYWFYIIEEE